MFKHAYILFLAALLPAAALAERPDTRLARTEGVLRHVDTYIGTSGHGHTFMGAAAPFGAVQLGPSNFNKGWDWCSGYHYSDSLVIGFAHLHLSGTGCSDTGDLLFMPFTGPVRLSPGTQENPDSGYASRYSHDREIARPAYYALHLDDYGIDVELTASERVGFHRYTFPANDDRKQVMINLKDANGDDRATGTYIEQKDAHTIRGYRYSTGWSKRQEIFFTARFSVPVKLRIYADEKPVDDYLAQGIDLKGIVELPADAREVLVKVGISPVGMNNAAMNIDAEIPSWDFASVVRSTNARWEKELAKVKIEGGDEAAQRIFYTAMYHAFLQPNLFNDVNGDYRGSDKRVYRNAAHQNHTVFSLWDTYRAAHPLYTLLQPERVPDFIATMLGICDQQGYLPVWHLYGSDTREMIGIQSVPVVADAIVKGFSGFDYERAYRAMKRSMLSDYKGLDILRKQRYLPSEEVGESVAKGLEYAIADASVARVAHLLGHTEDAALFEERASRYAEYWDSETEFFRGKLRNGTWRMPFDPFHSQHRNDDYCEGTAWQYIWLVPHDVQGLVKLFGSEEAFTRKLDALFVTEGDMGEGASGDISGLIGQYAHGNEPGHHTAYLYPFVGQQWKTAQLVRRILDEMYSDRPDGLQGNEDCGQMSSWYVFSALGFYPVNPSNGIYVLGSPRFDKARIALPQGRSFTVEAENNSPENIYIQSATLDGKPYTRSYLTHEQITRGGKLSLKMGPRPNPQFGTALQDRPTE